MSLKRKASALEEPSLNHECLDGSPGPSWRSASPSSATSASLTPSSEHGRGFSSWNVGAVPYMNSRTLKRYRDNRPDEHQVHDNTLKRLYDAQRLHLDEAMPMSEVLFEDEPACEDVAMDDVQISAFSESTHPKQKTLESFFSIK